LLGVEVSSRYWNGPRHPMAFSEQTVTIDVGGEQTIKVSVELFGVVGDNKFASLFSGRWQNQLDSEGRLFVDYSPKVFLPLVEFLRLVRDSEPDMPAPVKVDASHRRAFIRMMLVSSFHPQDFRRAGVEVRELCDCGAGFNAGQLKEAGFNAGQLREAGFNAGQLREAGFNAGQLREAGFDARQLREAGFDARQLREAGFDARQLREAGFEARQLRAAGFNAEQLIEAGFDEGQLRAAGFNVVPLMEGGFDAW